MDYKVLKPNEGNFEDLRDFITEMDKFFIPTLASRVNIDEYCHKIFSNATRFIYVENGTIIAMSIAYINPSPKESFGTYMAVRPEYEADGLGLDLTRKSIKYAKEIGSSSFRLMMRASNQMLLKFYLKQGFKITKEETYPNSDIKEYELVKNFNKQQNGD